jgi:hypothetical protein
MSGRAASIQLVNTRSPQEFAEIIQSRWQDRVKNILEVCMWLETAREELGPSKFSAMVRDDLKWSKSMASQLLAIGRDGRLVEVQHVKLPPSWGTLYQLTRLTDEEFERGIDSGIIHAGMERKDVRLLKPPKPQRAISAHDLCLMEVRRHVFETAQDIQPEQMSALFCSQRLAAEVERPAALSA